MKDFQNLLTILDKPKHPQVALYRSMALQHHYATHVDLVSFCWHSMVGAAGPFDTHQRKQLKQSIVNERKAWLRELLRDKELTDRDISLQTIWTDQIADWVCASLAKQPRDLVLKTLHRSGGLLHSSLDWELLHRCPVPLLLTTDKKHARSGRIIAALDLRSTDAVHERLNHKVLALAHRLAEAYGAKVHCISVFEYSEVLRDLDVIDVREKRRAFLKAHEAQLNELLKPYGVPKSRQHFPAGKVGQRVQQLSHKLNADLLVVGTHARRVRQRMHLGNSAQRIVAKSICDVLAVTP